MLATALPLSEPGSLSWLNAISEAQAIEQRRHHPHFQYCISDPSLDVIFVQCTFPIPIYALPITDLPNEEFHTLVVPRETLRTFRRSWRWRRARRTLSRAAAVPELADFAYLVPSSGPGREVRPCSTRVWCLLGKRMMLVRRHMDRLRCSRGNSRRTIGIDARCGVLK